MVCQPALCSLGALFVIKSFEKEIRDRPPRREGKL
jgi:hypothetical protein